MDSPWVFWIIAAVVAAIIEIATPSFGFVFGSLAAVVSALVSPWVGVPAQILIFAVVLLASLAGLRPIFMKKLHLGADKIPSRTQVLVGKQGQVTEAIDPITGRGRVSVEGEDWAARSQVPVGAGSVITVEGADGIVLIVQPRVSGH